MPPRLSLRVLRCPPRGPLRLRPGKAGSAALAALELSPRLLPLKRVDHDRRRSPEPDPPLA